MRRLVHYYIPLVLPVLTSLGLLQAQTVSTTPVGYRTDTIPAGNNPYAPTFVHADSFVSNISSLTESGTNTIVTLSDATLTASAYDEGSSYPAYYLEITEEGTNEGYVFDIVSNTTNTVTVSGLLTSGSALLSSGFSLTGTESVAIRKHMTLSDLFTGATGLSLADSLKFFKSNGTYMQYFWDGSKWTSDFVADDSSCVIYPGTGFIGVFSQSVTLTSTGHVKSTKTKVPLYSGAINFVSPLAPSDTTIGGHQATDTLDLAESIKVFNQDGSLSTKGEYFYDGSKMTKDFTNDHSSDSFKGHNASLVTVGSDKYITFPAAYTEPD